MKHKRQYLILCIPLLLLLLSACHADPHIRIYSKAHPADTTLALLVQEETAEFDTPDNTGYYDAPDYRADGWCSLMYVEHARGSAYDDDVRADKFLDVYTGGGSTESIIAFARKHPQVRLAVFDADGQPVRLGEPFTIAPEGAYYVAREVEYHWDTGEAEITDGYREKVNGYNLSQWCFNVILFAQICGVLMILGMVLNLTLNRGTNKSAVEWLLLGIFSVPFIAGTVMYILLQTSPKWTWKADGLNQTDLYNLLTVNALWLLTALVVVIHQLRLRNQNQEPQERKYV